MKRVIFLVFTITALLLGATQAFAAGAGGFRVEVPHAGPMGKGSAFVGEANNPSAVYYNPAGLTQLDDGIHMSIGNSWLGPQASHEDFAGNKSQMARQHFNIPHFYLVSNFGLENFTFGLGGLSSFGLATEWAPDSFSRYNATSSEVKNIDTLLTVSYKINDQWSVGVGADYDYTTLNKTKRLSQAGGADGTFSIKGKSDSVGYRISTLYQLNERHQFGLMYRSAIQQNYNGKTYLDDLNSSGSNYLGLVGSKSFEVETTVETELPQSIVMGYSYRPNDKWVFNFDTEWMDWSSIEDEKLEYKNPLTAGQSAVLNNGNPVPHDWNGVFSAAVGGEYAWSDDLRLRLGYYFHQTPIPEDTFEASLPDSNSHGFTTGFGYDVNNNSTVDLAYSTLFFENRTIDNSIASGTIKGTYKQLINMVLLTYNYDF